MLFCGISLNAQTIHKCLTKELIDYREQQFPGYKQAIDNAFNSAKELGTNAEPTRDILTIPVVFHVVYNTPQENLADEVIQNQLEILNADYARENADTVNMRAEFQPVAGSTRIRFVMAAVDPDGNPTTGITRTQTNTASFGSFNIFFGDFSDVEKVKSTAEGGHDAWDQAHYLNIWVCDMSVNGNALLLGYATPPADLPNWPGGAGIEDLGDGVVLQYQVVGSNNPIGLPGYDILGRTASHEVGHYLGLRHIWGDEDDCSGSDGIDDTPGAAGASQQDCDEAKNTCMDNIAGTNLHDMIENFMDYSAETCQNSFTKGQRDLMEGVLGDQRWDLVHDNPALGVTENVALFSCYPNPTADHLTISSANQMQRLNVYDLDGRKLLTQTLTGTTTSIELNSLTSGVYILQVEYPNGLQSQQRITVAQ